MTEQEIINEVDSELEDFDLLAPVFEVHLYGFDEDDNYADYNKYLATFETYNEAEAFAVNYQISGIPELPVRYARIEVESVLMSGNTIYSTETLFSRVITWD